MELPPIFFDACGAAIYGGQAISALYGLFLVVMLFRRIAQKRFASTARMFEFLDQVKELLAHKQLDKVAELCDSPPYWSKAVPQLILLALSQTTLDLPKLRRALAEHFERDVLADLEYRMSWISTIVKSAPMLGLLGTVVGMIAAFAKIASVSKETGTDPAALANDISFALLTTAYGLMIAIPLTLAAAAIHVRISKLQDGVQHGVGEFLAAFEPFLRRKA